MQTETLDPADILTPAELAKRLKVPQSWVFEKTRHRATVRDAEPLPCIRMGRYLRFHWPAVSAWLLRQGNSNNGGHNK
jgi:hypothetical protein